MIALSMQLNADHNRYQCNMATAGAIEIVTLPCFPNITTNVDEFTTFRSENAI